MSRVLIATGGLITGKERSVLLAARKTWEQWRAADEAWLDLKVKLVMAEPVVASRLEALRHPEIREALTPRRELEPPSLTEVVLATLLHREGLPYERMELDEVFSAPEEVERKLVMAEPVVASRLEALRHPEIREALTPRRELEPPSLTEVVLATLLHREGLPYERMELDEVFSAPEEVERKLAATDCVFLSSTYLHDLSEVEPLLRRLKRPHNRIVLGGALAGILHDRWEGAPELDVLAIGYGERLITPLADWIRSGYRTLEAPEGGRLIPKGSTGSTAFLYSGVPKDLSLDGLPTPDWRLAPEGLRMIYYESVRGCPYRCSFCNYPYLFDDTKFRTKSAEKIAADWQRYVAELGVEYITCLDSLFTMPKPRLRELCRLLIERDVKVKWICYARADDLADEETVALMKAAGAWQVQIGIESGDAQLLANMDKACTVEANAKALRNCRRHGLTSVVSLIVGFPGETAETLERTYRFLAATPPDFYFLATFSTRVAGVPLLRPENRARFGLRVQDNLRSMAPYWEHDTMSCAEVGNHVRSLDRRLMRGRIALNAAVFYPYLLSFQPERREALLDFQARAAGHPLLTGAFGWANRWVDGRLRRAVGDHLAASL